MNQLLQCNVKVLMWLLILRMDLKVRLELSFRPARTEGIAREKQDLKDGKESGKAGEIKVKCMEANDVGLKAYFLCSCGRRGEAEVCVTVSV